MDHDIKDVLTIEVDSALGSMATLKTHLPRLRALGISVEFTGLHTKLKPRVRRGVCRLMEPEQLKTYLAELDRR